MASKGNVTVEEVVVWCPCIDYEVERIAELFAGREALAAGEIAAMDIPVKDRVWALLHEEFLGPDKLRLLACDYVEHADRVTEPGEWMVDTQSLSEMEGLSAASGAWQAAYCAAREIGNHAAAAWVVAYGTREHETRQMAWEAAESAEFKWQLEHAMAAINEAKNEKEGDE